MDTNAFSDWISLRTHTAKEALQSRLQTEWITHPTELAYRRAKFIACKRAFNKDPTFFPTCDKLFTELAQIEQSILPLMEQSAIEEETYNELLFLKPILQPCNFIPYVLFLWSIIRVYIIPGLALIIPILILCMPYIILTYLFQIPITFSNYTELLHSIISGNIEFLRTGIYEGAGITLKECGIIAVTLIQGVIQPYWTHTHLKTVDQLIQDHGRILLRYRELYTELYDVLGAHGLTFFRCPLPAYDTKREGTAHMILHSAPFKLGWKYIGSIEVLLRLAHNENIHAVTWVQSQLPEFHGHQLFDFQVKDRIPISIELTAKQRHVLLTGPNKGGKSTVLRSITTSMYLAHTYGCSLGHVKLTPFQAMHVCLTPDDLPGSKSRFEREIEFTAATLRTTQPIMVLIDELYHSTNPSDAERSCDIYCNQLWKKPNVISVISTHLFGFVEKADKNIQRLCCPATNHNGAITFHYGLRKGICTISSVDLLLEKNGLCVFHRDEKPTRVQKDVQ